MTNLFNETPIYITVADVRDSTNIDGLKTESDTRLTRYIIEAQGAVDNYILNNTYDKYDSEQKYMFPISIDLVETMPEDVKIATLYIVERIYSI